MGLVRGDHAGDLDAGDDHAVEVFDGQLQQLRPTALEQAGGVADFQLHIDAVTDDLDVFHATGADRVLVQVRVGVLAEDGFHRCASDGAHGQLR